MSNHPGRLSPGIILAIGIIGIIIASIAIPLTLEHFTSKTRFYSGPVIAIKDFAYSSGGLFGKGLVWASWVTIDLSFYENAADGVPSPITFIVDCQEYWHLNDTATIEHYSDVFHNDWILHAQHDPPGAIGECGSSAVRT